MHNAVFPHPSPVIMHDMDFVKRTWLKLSGFFLETLDLLDTVNLARREGTVFNRVDGMLTGAGGDAEIRLEHSPGTPYDRNMGVSICIITAEPLSFDFRIRINRMFSEEFPRLSLHFRTEFQKLTPQASKSIPQCPR